MMKAEPAGGAGSADAAAALEAGVMRSQVLPHVFYRRYMTVFVIDCCTAWLVDPNVDCWLVSELLGNECWAGRGLIIFFGM